LNKGLFLPFILTFTTFTKHKKMMKLNIKKDRKAIKDIIYNNLKLIEIAGNKDSICQELADAILLYFIEKH